MSVCVCVCERERNGRHVIEYKLGREGECVQSSIEKKDTAINSLF